VYIKIYCFIIVYLVRVLPCVKFYLISSIAILLVVIVSNIGNELNIILINVMINILSLLDVY
jgi:hypothetical protein